VATMRCRLFSVVLLCSKVLLVAIVTGLCTPLQMSYGAGPVAQAAAHRFAVQDGHFTLDGKPFQIISGEMHYPRIPRAYWRDRLKMAKAMGLNTITTYVFWNLHEPRLGVYDFSDNNDIAEFIREAQQEGLYVILRPGPYVCAEWEWGGYPAWLLKDHDIIVRSSDPKFMTPAVRWLARLGQELAPLQIGKGGPIIAVQVENEYGSFGNDHAYMEQMHQAILKSGFTDSLLYTADGPQQLPNGTLPDLPAVINFGPGEAEKAFATFKQFRSQGPFMNGEYWAGWFDNWGGKHASTDTAAQAKELDWMLRQGYSVSIYMLHGGTNFGWMNGANSNGKNYEPDVTSYDYDSALDESGRPTPKYYAFRDVIARATGVAPVALPGIEPTSAISEFALSEAISLWQTLPEPRHSTVLLSMEDVDQSYGYILYRTELHGPISGELELNELHDYAQIYLDGKQVGTLDRRLAQNHLSIGMAGDKARLDILVENTGRVNYSMALRGERKGITKEVTLAGRTLTDWDIYSLPMTHPENLHYTKTDCKGPCFYHATFSVGEKRDTFLDTSAFSKGQVWVNGHPLGRVWSIGPQETLYVPGPWLKKGKNSVVVFDLNGEAQRTLQGRETPILNAGPK
jgi:beta-galactosidase